MSNSDSDYKFRQWNYRRHKPIAFDHSDVIPAQSTDTAFIWHGITEYIGVILKCTDCGIDFNFSAKEQKTWYENWNFSVHSYPLMCKDCRRTKRNAMGFVKQFQKEIKRYNDTNCNANVIVDLVSIFIEMDFRISSRHKQKLLAIIKKSSHSRKNEIRLKLIKHNPIRTSKDYLVL